jgi:serine/threonine protein kinase
LADLGLIVKRNGGINTPVDFEEGDSRYLPKELLDSECVSSGYITRADIFSLACSAYELALQRPLPKAGESWEAIRKAEIVLPAQYSHDLTGVLKAMLHPDPRCRPTAHQVLEHPVMRSMEERRNYDDNVNLKNALNQAHLKIINLQAKLAQMQQRQKALKRRESFHTIANQASQGQSRDVSPSPMDEDQRDFIGHPNNASQPHPSLRRSATTILGMDVDSLEPMIVSVINSYLNQGRMGAMDGVLQAMTTDIANAIVNARNVSQTLSHRSILTASTPNLERQETFGAVPSPATQRANPLSSSTSQIAAPQQHQQLSAPMQAPSTPPAKIRHIQRAQSVIRISKK